MVASTPTQVLQKQLSAPFRRDSRYRPCTSTVASKVRRVGRCASVLSSMGTSTPGAPSGSVESPFLVCRQLAEDHYWVVSGTKLPLWALYYSSAGMLFIILLSLAGYALFLIHRQFLILELISRASIRSLTLLPFSQPENCAYFRSAGN